MNTQAPYRSASSEIVDLDQYYFAKCKNMLRASANSLKSLKMVTDKPVGNTGHRARDQHTGAIDGKI